MTQVQTPEQGKAKFKPAVQFPEDEQIRGVDRPCLEAACYGNPRIANILNYFVYEAGREISRLKMDRGKTNVVPLQRTHKEILHSVSKVSRKTLIGYLDKLNEWGYVASQPYHKDYTVNIKAIEAAFATPPVVEPHKRTFTRKSCKVTTLSEELQPSNVVVEEKVVGLQHRVEELQLFCVTLQHRVEELQLFCVTLQHSKSDEVAPQARAEYDSDSPRLLGNNDVLEDNKESNTRTADADDSHSSFLSELALSEIRMDAMLDTIVNLSPPAKAEEEPPQEIVQAPPQKPNIRIVPIANGTTNTPPPNGKGNRGRSRQSVQLTLQGQHIHEVYQTFKERRIALTESTIKAANGLGEVVEDDAVFLKVLEAIRDNAFLKERKVGTDLDFVYRKYDSYVDIIKRPEEPQKTGPSQKTPPPQTEKKPLTPEKQARLNELLAKRRAEAQAVEMRA